MARSASKNQTIGWKSYLESDHITSLCSFVCLVNSPQCIVWMWHMTKYEMWTEQGDIEHLVSTSESVNFTFILDQDNIMYLSIHLGKQSRLLYDGRDLVWINVLGMHHVHAIFFLKRTIWELQGMWRRGNQWIAQPRVRDQIVLQWTVGQLNMWSCEMRLHTQACIWYVYVSFYIAFDKCDGLSWTCWPVASGNQQCL